MTAVLTLARHTFLDALRERAFAVLGFFVVLMLAASRLLNPLALGAGRRDIIPGPGHGVFVGYLDDHHRRSQQGAYRRGERLCPESPQVILP